MKFIKKPVVIDAEQLTEERENLYLKEGKGCQFIVSFTREIAAALRAERESANPKWLPIETAPKDGTDFLACTEHRDIGVASWQVYEACEHYPREARFEWAGEGHEATTITHWMPLPEPPQQGPSK
jgi:hypothetical protein